MLAVDGSWWGQRIPAGEIVMLDFRLDSTLVITNACLGEYDQGLTEPVKLTASVKTLNFDDEPIPKDDQVECGYFEENVTICNLVPNRCERTELALCFTFTHCIQVTNHGKADVFLSGRLEDVESFEYDYLEEEEEEEDADEPQNE